MTLKNLFIKLLLIGVAIILFFLVVLIFGSQKKSKSIADKFPYNEIVQREFRSYHVCYVYLKDKRKSIDYPYRLEMDQQQINQSETPIYEIPIGTILKINDAQEITSPVSGSKHCIVYGTLVVKELNEEVNFQMYWGENPTYGLYDHDENYDIYKLAPWQEKILAYKYFWDGTKKPHDWEAWNDLSK